MKRNDILARIKEILEREHAEQIYPEIAALLNASAHRGRANPDYVDEDGQGWRWCNRHQQYEKIETFLARKNGTLNPECAYATEGWKKIGREMNRALKNNDAALYGQLALKRKAPYNFDDDYQEFHDKVELALG